MARAKPIPEGRHALTPYLRVKEAAGAIEFYKAAFGAREMFRLSEPSGRIGHAELEIGDSQLMICDEFPEKGLFAPRGSEEAPMVIHLYVEDVDDVARAALAAGARIINDVRDEFYGDRTCKLVDPYGHYWFVATHKEDVEPDEIRRRFSIFTRQAASAQQRAN
jgi:PhnB protein